MSDEVYKQQLIDRYHHLVHRRDLETDSVDSADSNPLCGDALRVQLRLDGGRVSDVAWQGEGCAISLVAIDLLAEKIKGMSAEDVLKLSLDDVKDLLGVELKPSREKCAMLGLRAMQKGLSGLG